MGDSYTEARVLRFFFEAGRRSATQEETPEEGALRRQRLKSSGRLAVSRNKLGRWNTLGGREDLWIEALRRASGLGVSRTPQKNGAHRRGAVRCGDFQHLKCLKRMTNVG